MSEELKDTNKTGARIVHIPRRHELDVLTTLIVFGLMFFHTASIFLRTSAHYQQSAG